MISTFCHEGQGGVYVSIKLQPRASRNQIQRLHGQELKIAVTAPPVDSAANSALIDLLAHELKVSRSAIQIVRGQTSRHKTVFIANARVTDIVQALKL